MTDKCFSLMHRRDALHSMGESAAPENVNWPLPLIDSAYVKL